MADNVQEDKSLSSSLSGVEVMVTGGVVFLLVVFFIVEIAVGAAYIHDCPVAPILPAYLIVLGLVCLLLVGLFALLHPFPAVGDHKIWTGSVFTAFIFALGWFFYGSYLVYTMYPIYHSLINRPPRSEGSHFAPLTSDYTKNGIYPFNSTSAHFTAAAPDYTQSTNSLFPPTAPDDKPNSSSGQSQTQSPSSNQTTMTTNTNQTLMNLIQTLALGSNQTNREDLNTPQTGAVTSVTLYCDKNLYLFVFCTTTLIYVFIALTCAISSAKKKCRQTNELN